MSNTIQKLINHFERLPGVGPRQASRFVYALLNAPRGVLLDFGTLLTQLPDAVRQCPSCGLFHGERGDACRQCSDTERDATLLMVVAKDTDVSTFERLGVFKGHYVILGGLLPIAGEGAIREELLKSTLQARGGVRELILALPATPEGDLTSDRVKDIVRSIRSDITITLLARGLSTGTDVEYSDRETLQNALEHRR